MSRVLVTGFGPWEGSDLNPAKAVADTLNGQVILDAAITSTIVPALFGKSIDVATDSIKVELPDIVLMMGEYGGRSMITVERIAQNLNDSSRYQLADNDGKVMQGDLTIADGPAAYYSPLPIRAMVKAMCAAGIPADISDTPGTNICNHMMYGILHFIAVNELPIRAGWIHLPHLPETAALEDNLGAPSMSVQTAAAGVSVAIAAIIEHDVDIDEPIVSRWQI